VLLLSSPIKAADKADMVFFRPFGAASVPTYYPRLAPWAVILRRFAAAFEAILPLSNSRSSCDTVSEGRTRHFSMSKQVEPEADSCG